MNKLLYFFLFSLFCYSCSADQAGDSPFQATPVDGEITNADLIRNPVTADGLEDTVNVAKMSFAEPDFNFGTVATGTEVTNDFAFTNTGKVPLLIADARSTCGCTVPDWPRTPIAPGDSGVISVVFDTKNKVGRQAKPITITANTYPVATRLRLMGVVTE